MSGCRRFSSMSRYVQMSKMREPPSSRAMNSRKVSEGWSDQCRSSSTITSGRAWLAVFRKLAMESKRRKRTESGSSICAGG